MPIKLCAALLLRARLYVACSRMGRICCRFSRHATYPRHPSVLGCYRPSACSSRPLTAVLCLCASPYRCYVDDKVSKVAWLNRSNIIFAGQDKWSLDPRVDLVTKGQLEYSLRIQKVI